MRELSWLMISVMGAVSMCLQVHNTVVRRRQG